MESLQGGQTVFYYATEGIIVADSKGVITQINPSAERLFGYDGGELKGQHIEVLIPRRLAKKHEQHRGRYSVNPHARSMGQGMDLFGVRKDGTEFPVEVSLSPYSNEQGSFVMAFVIDITVRKNAEAASKKQKEELEQLNRELDKKVKQRTMVLEEAIAELNRTKEELSESLKKEKELGDLKSRFVSMASHEFRTPLAGILSSLSLIEKYGELNDKDKQARHVEKIKISVTNLTDILNDMLSISRIEEGKYVIKHERVNMNEYGADVVKELRSVAKEGQKLNYTFKGIDDAIFDKKILRHLLFNLVSNAIKFSDEGKAIEIGLTVDEKEISIAVKDGGIGIAPEDQKHLFERFFRAENAMSIQGTGLGLNIVAKYVEILNGAIDCKSKLGKGTTFTIKIPNNQHG